MKIVINRCFGGFGVSLKALRELIALDFGGIDRCPESENSWLKSIVWTDLGDGFLGNDILGTYIKRDGVIYSFDRDNKWRDDPKLVGVIERLGSEANGQFSDLKVVEIPDDVNWEIEEYDGLEHISEVHRTWA